MFNTNSEKGVSLYISFMIMIVLLSVALGMSTILVSEVQTIREMGKSVIAYYAAETGFERILYNIYQEGKLEEVEEDWGEEYGYTAEVSFCDPNTCVRSKGRYKGVQRALQTTLIGNISPLISSCSVAPGSGLPGDTFDIQVDISGLGGVNSSEVSIENSEGTEVDSESLSVVADITYEGSWDSPNDFDVGTYWVVIKAVDGQDHLNESDCGTILLELE